MERRTSLTHDKAPEHQCLPCLMCHVCLSWPASSGCPFIIWHFFSECREVSVLSELSRDSFIWELICHLENSLHQCSLPSPTLRVRGPLSPGCMHSICIHIIYSETEIANPSLGWRNIYLVTHTLLSWGTERGFFRKFDVRALGAVGVLNPLQGFLLPEGMPFSKNSQYLPGLALAWRAIRCIP